MNVDADRVELHTTQQGWFMPEGYCVKCKSKKEIADAAEELMKNGRKAIKGKCPTCGVVMFKILGGKNAAPDAILIPAAPLDPSKRASPGPASTP